MNTTYKPVDREFLEMLAAAKARGITWMRLAEMTKKPVVELEVIPWREPKAWAKACKYAEKLVHCEMLSEILAQLRVQMNDNVNNARSKSQVANSVVRVIQLQHSLRTPKKLKKGKPSPIAEPTPTPKPVPTSPTVNEPVVTSPTAPVNIPKPVASSTPLATMATVLLFVLCGVLMFWGGTLLNACETLTAAIPNVHTASSVDQDRVSERLDLNLAQRGMAGGAQHEGASCPSLAQGLRDRCDDTTSALACSGGVDCPRDVISPHYP